MDSNVFITTINVENKNSFNGIKVTRILNILRKLICDHILFRNSENEYFDLTRFIKENGVKNIHTLLQIVGEELTQAGWKWQLSFGDTAIFIFEKDVPANCW